MLNSSDDFHEKEMSYLWLVPAKLLHIIIQLTPFNTLDGHCIINMQFLRTTSIFLNLHNSLRNYLYEVDNIGVALDALQNLRVIHENEFLVNIGLILIIRPLNDL